MRKSSHFAYFVAILVTLPLTSNARADWLSEYTYDVGIGTSASGPFASPLVTVWSSNVPAGFSPSSIDVLTPNAPDGGVVDGHTVHSLAFAYVSRGNFDKDFSSFTQSPFFIKLTIHDKPSGLSDSLVFSGGFDPIGPSTSFFMPKLTGDGTRTIGDHQYNVNVLPPMPMPIAMGEVAGQTTFTWEAFGFGMTIDRSEVAPTPEPASLLLALPAALALGIAALRRRRSSGRMALFLLPETEFSNE
jgi:MYXO-CTERM domain-containing protein